MKKPYTTNPKYLPAQALRPAVAHRREIPRNRNDDTRTRITDQANTLNATVIARSAATWQSPGREDLLAYTDKILLPWGISPLRSDYRPHSGRNDSIKPSGRVVISSEGVTEVGSGTKPTTRCAAGRGRPALPTASPRIGQDVISSVSREIPCGRNGTKHTRASQMPAAAHRREIPRDKNGTKHTRAS